VAPDRGVLDRRPYAGVPPEQRTNDAIGFGSDLAGACEAALVDWQAKYNSAKWRQVEDRERT